VILIARDIGGTVEWYAPQRPDAGPTVQVVNKAGSAEVAAGTAATLDSVDTTLSAGAAAGATTVTLTSGASLSAGRRYRVSASGGPSEMVECKSFSGTTVYLANPLAYAHANGSDFEGTRISYAITAGVSDTAEENWRAIFSWAVSAASQAAGVVEFTVTRHPIYNPASVPDLYAVASSALRDRISLDTSLGDALTRAWDEILDTLYASGVTASSIVGSEKLKRAVVYRALGLLAETYGRDYRDERTELAERCKTCLDVFQSVGAFDDDEDANIETHERGTAKGGDLWRG
jgi:hypothetical protein